MIIYVISYLNLFELIFIFFRKKNFNLNINRLDIRFLCSKFIEIYLFQNVKLDIMVGIVVINVVIIVMLLVYVI